MNNFANFLLPYGIPTIIIAVFIAIISLVLRKVLPEKFSMHLKSYIPFVLGVILYSAYDMIFISKAFSFSEETLSAGLICGTLGTIVFAFIKNLKSGKVITDKVILAIFGILVNLIDEKSALSLSEKIKGFFAKEIVGIELLALIASEIISVTGNQDEDLAKQTATLIIEAVDSVKMENNSSSAVH